MKYTVDSSVQEISINGEAPIEEVLTLIKFLWDTYPGYKIVLGYTLNYTTPPYTQPYVPQTPNYPWIIYSDWVAANDKINY